MGCPACGADFFQDSLGYQLVDVPEDGTVGDCGKLFQFVVAGPLVETEVFDDTPLARIQLELGQDFVREPVATDGGDELAGALFELRFGQAVGQRFTNHHEDACAELFDVASEEERLADAMVTGDGAVGPAEAIRRKRWRQLAGVPYFETVGEKQDLDGRR